MTWEIITFLVLTLLPVFGAIIGFIVNGMMHRLDKLEQGMCNAMTEESVRRLIADKIDPLREDIREIKDKLTRLFDIYIKQHQED